jgi:hypothetical protein
LKNTKNLSKYESKLNAWCSKMKHNGKYPGLLPHVLRAISERKGGGGSKSISLVENAIRNAYGGRVDPSKNTYTMRRRRRKKEGGRRRRRRRRRSQSTDATSIFSDKDDEYETETDSEADRSRSRTRTPEPSDRGRRRRRSRKRRRKRRNS